MKRKCLNRILSILLVAAMVLSLGPTVLAAQEQRVPFRQVEADAPLEREPADLPQDTSYAPTDLVRVSIVLEDRPGLEQMEASSGLSTADLAVSPQMQQTRQSLETNQAALARRISNQVLGGEPLDVVWNLTLAANLISANVPYGKVEEIQAMPGVKTVVLETRYEPAVYSQGPADPNMSTSAEMIGSSAAYAAGLTGAGTRIAVIDTGTDTDHQSFDAAAFAYALAEDAKNSGRTYDLLDEAEIREKLAQLNISRNGGPSAQELYVNEKLPFGYNYVDHDLDITHDHDDQGEHGSHVAGIATANRYIPSEDGYTDALTAVHVQGVAPDAQLLTMKVFGKNGGAYDSDYMAAIEDAILLGCDAVNLSLGSTSPGYATNAVYQDLLDRLSETDVVVSVAAGNAGSWADGVWNGHLYSDAVSLDMVGSPGSYTNALTVASADNVGYTGRYLTVQERAIFYTETISRNKPLETLAGQPLEYVLVEGVGDDWTGIDLTGKVAVCARGTINFSEKANKAAEAGAVAVLIYNNVPGALSMDLSEYWYEPPCVSLTQSDGQWMRDQGELHTETIEVDNWGEIVTREIQYYTGELTVAQNVSTVIYDEPYTMSDFSSWGVPGSLELKPEITAPGGNIYSVNGVIPGGESYETMSGTSMASPQIAGMTALVAQYMEEAGLQEQTGLSTRVLAQSLLMSTAEPLVDAESGSYYPAIQQGAGLANVGSAISASSYVLVDGQPDGKVKAELGDDPERTGTYQFSFTLNNLTNEAQEYLLSADLFTQDLFEDYASMDEKWLDEIGEEFQTAWYLSKTTVALDADIAWTVDGKAVEMDNRLIHMDFDGNGTVNRDDAQALLDYASGNREEISSLDYADLDGSGDVTTYDAYLLLKGLNGGTVTLPAGGKTDITVTMTLTEAQKKALDEKYESGAYVQGYVFAAPTATSEGVQGVTHSIPVLAFYGNWTDASMFDRGCKAANDLSIEKWPYTSQTSINYLTYTVEGSSGLYYFGGNPTTVRDETYVPERASLNNQNGDALRQYFITPIRNAAAGKLMITNCDTGEVYFQREFGPQAAAYYYAAADAWASTAKALALNWKGTDAQGVPLEEGTAFDVTVILAPEYYVDHETGEVDWDALGEGAYLTTRAYIDNTEPELVSISLDPQKNTLELTFRDNRFIAACRIATGIFGSVWGGNQMEAGQEVSRLFDVDSKRFESLARIWVYDYSYNYKYYEFDISSLDVKPDIEHEFAIHNTSTEWYAFNHPNTDDPSIYDVLKVYGGNSYFQAATNADGFVFASDENGNLYVMHENDLRHETWIRKLDFIPVDLAYNPVDEMIYGVTDTGSLFRFDQLCTKVEQLGNIGALNTNTLACDGSGNFYCLEYPTGALYTFTAETYAAPTMVGETGREMYGIQSLEWNCNDGQLYWGWSNNPNNTWWITSYVLQVDPNTGATQEFGYLFSDPMPALFIFDLKRNDRWDSSRYPAVDTAAQIDMPATLSLLRSETQTLPAAVLPWTAADRGVTWSSSNPEVASVDESGKVTAVGAGQCTITATSILTPQISSSCTVTVEAYEATLQGVMQNTDGNTTLFSWGSETRTNTAGPNLPVNVGAVAYDPGNDWLYAQDRGDGHYMHKFQAGTGELLETSQATAKSVASWDMAFCQYLEEDAALSVYGTYICAPERIMDNNQLVYALDLSDYLHLTTAATQLTTVASAGEQQITVDVTDEEGNVIGSEETEAECFCLLDDKGYVWAVWMYHLDDGYGAVLGLYPTTLAGTLPFPMDGEYQNCSMVEAPATGALYLSYFTGNSTEFYGLYPQRDADGKIQSFRAGKLGGLEEDVWPVALYQATAIDAQTSGKRLCQQYRDATIQTAEFAAMDQVAMHNAVEEDIPTGTLHAVPNERTATQSDGKLRVPVEISAGSHSGLVTVNYDATALTLEDVATYGELTSLRQEEGFVTLGFADLEGLTTAATLTFAAKEDAPNRTDVTYTYLQQEEKTGTAEKQVDIRTETLELHCPSEAFTDLDTNQWYHEGVDYVLEQELMIGMSNTQFAPNGTMTRGQLMTVLHRMAGEPETKGQSPFADVKAGKYYTEPIAWAFETGIAKGMTATAFAPNAPVTREQMVTFLARYAQLQDVDTASSAELDFTDAGSVSDYAQEAMAWAVETGLVQGMGNGKLDPKGPATRAQMATVLMRFCESILK